MTFTSPDIEREAQAFFEHVYAARRIARGGPPSAGALRRLADGAYADYTIPLFEREIADASDGQLLEATFTDISVHLDEWQPAADGQSGTAFVLHDHHDETGKTYWLAVDFFQPEARRWVSEIAGLAVAVPSAGHG